MSNLLELGDVSRVPIRAEEGDDGRGGMGVLAGVILAAVALALGIAILHNAQG